jgi:hypothetical protein
MALGYKQIIHELSVLPSLKEYDAMLLTEAIYMAMLYLNQRLVDNYGMYAPEPKRVWSDLHQLYRYAESNQTLHQQVDDPYPDTPLPVEHTIDFNYKRIILLSLAEPYHLMQYEVDDVYRLVASSVANCTIEPFTEFVTSGEYLIDLTSDTGPRYTDNETDCIPEVTRIVEMSAIRQQLDIHLKRLLSNNIHAAEFDSLSLIERQQRDMLLRLADAWGAALVRQTLRYSISGKVELTSGLNASHYYVSECTPFTPELDELRLVTNSDSELQEKANDTVIVDAFEVARQKDQIHKHQKYTLNPWSQKNISPIGVALNNAALDNSIDIRVGELVTYRTVREKHQRWQIGVIRWLQHEFAEETENSINVGIMNIANSAIPIGSKAIKGLGSGTDYFRGLLIPRQVPLNQTRSLILPALLYDVGSVLVINMKRRLFYAKLTRMMLSTRSFTQFEFDIIKRPGKFDFDL